MQKIFTVVLAVLVAALISSCNTSKSLQTNTAAGLFSLSGTWSLSSTTDSTAMVGTTISVSPASASAAIRSVSNNKYCLKQNDRLWRNIKISDAGNFTLSELVSSCGGKPVYNDGTVSIVDSNKITVTTRTATNSELIQAWDRVK